MAEVKVKQLDIFLWKGINRRGKTSNGEIRAGSVAEAKALLRQQGFTPSSVKKKANPCLLLSPVSSPLIFQWSHGKSPLC